MQPAGAPWWQQVTALVSVSAGGVITGMSFVPKSAAAITSPSSTQIRLLALEQSARAAPASDGMLRSAIVNVASYYLRLAAGKTPAEIEAIIWQHDSVDGVDHGASCAAFASLTLELGAQVVGQQSWVTGGTSYPWPLHKWADARVEPNPASLRITSILQDAEAHHRWHSLGDGYRPLPGDWVLFHGHVEVVTKEAGGVLHTIGGDSLPNFSVNAHEYPAPLAAQGVLGFVNNGELARGGATGAGRTARAGQQSAAGDQAAGQANSKQAKTGPGNTGQAKTGQGNTGQAAIPGLVAAPAAAAPAAPGPASPGPASGTGGPGSPAAGSASSGVPAAHGQASPGPHSPGALSPGPPATPAQDRPGSAGPRRAPGAGAVTPRPAPSSGTPPTATPEPTRDPGTPGTATPRPAHGTPRPVGGTGTPGAAPAAGTAGATTPRPSPGTATPGSARNSGTPGTATPGPARDSGTPGTATPGPARDSGTPGTATPGPTRNSGTPRVSTPRAAPAAGTSSTATPRPSPGAGTAGTATPGPARNSGTHGTAAPGPSAGTAAPRATAPGAPGPGNAPGGAKSRPGLRSSPPAVPHLAGDAAIPGVPPSVPSQGNRASQAGPGSPRSGPATPSNQRSARAAPGTAANGGTAGPCAAPPESGAPAPGHPAPGNPAAGQSAAAHGAAARGAGTQGAGTRGAGTRGAGTHGAGTHGAGAQGAGAGAPASPDPANGGAAIPGVPATAHLEAAHGARAPYARHRPPEVAPTLGSAAQQAFIAEIAPGAIAAQRKYGVPASVTIAQAIDESAWGQSTLATKDHNLFGIKGTGPAGSDPLPTQEYKNGQLVTVVAPFRVYHDISQSIDDHGRLLATSAYYRQPMADRHDPNAFAAALTGIYATDPGYGAKIIRLMHRYDLYRYDIVSSPAGQVKPAHSGASIPGLPDPAIPPPVNTTPPATTAAPSTPPARTPAPAATPVWTPPAAGPARTPRASATPAPPAATTPARTPPPAAGPARPAGPAAGSPHRPAPAPGARARPGVPPGAFPPEPPGWRVTQTMSARRIPPQAGAWSQRPAPRGGRPAGSKYRHQIPATVRTAFLTTAKEPLLREEPLYRDVASDAGIRWELLAACDWMQCRARQRYSPVHGEKLGTHNPDGTCYRTRSEALAQCAADLADLAWAVYRVDLSAPGPRSIRELANAFAAFRWGGLLRLHHTSAMEFPYSVAGLTIQHLNMRWPNIADPNTPDRPGSRFRMPFGAVPIVLGLSYPATA